MHRPVVTVNQRVVPEQDRRKKVTTSQATPTARAVPFADAHAHIGGAFKKIAEEQESLQGLVGSLRAELVAAHATVGTTRAARAASQADRAQLGAECESLTAGNMKLAEDFARKNAECMKGSILLGGERQLAKETMEVRCCQHRDQPLLTTCGPAGVWCAAVRAGSHAAAAGADRGRPCSAGQRIRGLPGRGPAADRPVVDFGARA